MVISATASKCAARCLRSIHITRTFDPAIRQLRDSHI